MINTLGAIRTFRCPNCKEMVNDSQKSCRFCGVAIDPAIAQLIGERQELVNRACTDASYLRSTAVAMYVVIGASVVFRWFVWGLFVWAFLVTLALTILLLIRWEIRYSNIISDDPDYAQAKKSLRFAFVLTLLALPTFIVAHIAFALLILGISSN